jgi:hypothetical protein
MKNKKNLIFLTFTLVCLLIILSSFVMSENFFTNDIEDSGGAFLEESIINLSEYTLDDLFFIDAEGAKKIDLSFSGVVEMKELSGERIDFLTLFNFSWGYLNGEFKTTLYNVTNQTEISISSEGLIRSMILSNATGNESIIISNNRIVLRENGSIDYSFEEQEESDNQETFVVTNGDTYSGNYYFSSLKKSSHSLTFIGGKLKEAVLSKDSNHIIDGKPSLVSTDELKIYFLDEGEESPDGFDIIVDSSGRIILGGRVHSIEYGGEKLLKGEYKDDITLDGVSSENFREIRLEGEDFGVSYDGSFILYEPEEFDSLYGGITAKRDEKKVTVSPTPKSSSGNKKTGATKIVTSDSEPELNSDLKESYNPKLSQDTSAEREVYQGNYGCGVEAMYYALQKVGKNPSKNELAKVRSGSFLGNLIRAGQNIFAPGMVITLPGEMKLMAKHYGCNLNTVNGNKKTLINVAEKEMSNGKQVIAHVALDPSSPIVSRHWTVLEPSGGGVCTYDSGCEPSDMPYYSLEVMTC